MIAQRFRTKTVESRRAAVRKDMIMLVSTNSYNVFVGLYSSVLSVLGWWVERLQDLLDKCNGRTQGRPQQSYGLRVHRDSYSIGV